MDSQPEYIHIITARPRLSEVSRLSPSYIIGLNGLPLPSMMPQTVKSNSGTMTPTWMMVSDQPVSSRPRMLMNVNTATMPTPMSALSVAPNPHWFCM